MNSARRSSSLMITVSDRDQLRVWRLTADGSGPVAILYPGFCRDSAVYLPARGSGVGHWLARLGFDVFVADGRGKGKSWPAMAPGVNFGADDIINRDIPALLKKVEELRPGIPQLWIGEGWGSALLHACYARYTPENVSNMIHVNPFRLLPDSRRWKVWQRAARLLTRSSGYFPANQWRFGEADEPRDILSDLLNWSCGDWKSADGDFDYGEVLSRCGLPRSLYVAHLDSGLFQGREVTQAYLSQLPPHDQQVLTIPNAESGASGLLQALSEEDQFPGLNAWLRGGAVLQQAVV